MKVLITGASKGIGRAIAHELFRAGHDVLIVARHDEALRDAAEQIKKASPGVDAQVLHCVCDVGEREQIVALRKYCDEAGFAPDMLVANAGIFLKGSLVAGDAKDLDEMLRVNVFGVFHLVQVFIDQLRSSSAPRVVIIGSTADREPYKFGPFYGVSKWALRGFAVNLRKELQADKIGVTLISPGGTLTDLWADRTLPPKRLLDPGDVGRLIVALCGLSDQAVVEEIVLRPILGDYHQ